MALGASPGARGLRRLSLFGCSPLAASRPHLAPTFLCPRVCSLRPSPAPAAGRPPTPPPIFALTHLLPGEKPPPYAP